MAVERITFDIALDPSGYAPKSQQYSACVGAFDLDVLTGTGETPLAAILDLLENHIDELEAA